MLISPKWQTSWMESQHCSKSIVSVPLPSQQAEKVLEDLRTQCCSPNKAVQLEALKCWGMWIHSQEPDEWKLNSVCFAAVRPLISKKLQPLYKDVDICTLKLSLMWALVVKVQNIIHLEGPQYILEVFLQSCLTWLSSANDDGCEKEVSSLIFKLLLGLFDKDESVSGIDRDLFPSLTANVLHSKKIFHRLAEKFLTVFVYWRKVQDKTVILKLWKLFLEHCELSCDHIPVPVWHKIFKLAGQISSEKSEPIKERLAFLHGCATTLKSALSSSKFIDFGNLLTTPCEAFLKKLVELCGTVECDECRDSEMFFHSKEICQVLSVQSVNLGGYALCIGVLDVLEEFWLPELFWGVWCGLVYCYKTLLQEIDKSQFTKIQTKFYRKLRGAAVNFELDRSKLHKDCISEVEEHISVLNISCLCPSHSLEKTNQSSTGETSLELSSTDCQKFSKSPVNQSSSEDLSKQIVDLRSTRLCGKFSSIALYNRPAIRRAVYLNFDLIKNVLGTIGVNFPKSLFNYSLTFRFIELQTTELGKPVRTLNDCSLQIKSALENVNEMKLAVSCVESKTPSSVPECRPSKRTVLALQEKEEDVEEDEISIRLTRSRRKAEEEKERNMERLTRRKRKSYEAVVQEILQKNKERKTEKNSRKKNSVSQKGKRNKKKPDKSEKKSESKPIEVSDRKLRNSVKEEPKKEKKVKKTDGRLENYFKVLSKKTKNEEKTEEKKAQKKKKVKEGRRESSCCKPEKEEREKKGETGWRQTSLKTMMSQKSQSQGRLRARKKDAEVENKTDIYAVMNSSPFKEVLHDHEYGKIDPHNFIFTSPEKKSRRSEAKKEGTTKPKLNKTENSGEMICESKITSECTKKEVETESVELILDSEPQIQNSEMEVLESEKPNLKEGETLREERIDDRQVELEKQEPPIEPEEPKVPVEPEGPKGVPVEPEKPKEVPVEPEEPKEVPVESEEPKEEPDVTMVEETPVRRGLKRTRVCENHVPNKRIKLEVEDIQEEKLPLEITEKENLEESQPPREKAEFSPLKTMSRALRMIALVPESTKGGQIQREASPRVEILKCKKVPNVDRNSRASKMLALLSENFVEIEDVSEVKVEDVSSWGGLASTPTRRTPVSSLKSPKSVKKRRSIRFDDAKNETVLFQTDTPPSQILEEKEKCRRVKLAEITVNLPQEL